MNEAIELHDSVLDSVKESGSKITVALRPAYIHKSLGEPGVNDGVVELQDLCFEFASGQIEGTLADLPADILDGELQKGSDRLSNMIALPCEFVGQVRFAVHLYPDYREVIISADGLKITPEGESRYLEDFEG